MDLKKIVSLVVLGAAVVAMNSGCSNAEAAKKAKKDGGVAADAGMMK